jgi:hypothetical protein
MKTAFMIGIVAGVGTRRGVVRRYGHPVSTREFRIKIRGEFKDLTAEQRAELLAEAAEHDELATSFIPEGHLSYDLSARPFFTFRFAEAGETDADLPVAQERAEAAARGWLDGRGLSYVLRASQAEDMSQAPLGKRQRRQQRG